MPMRSKCLALLLAAAPLVPVTAHDSPTPPAATSAPRQLFAIVYSAGPAWKAGLPMKDQGLGPHGSYVKALFDRGIIHAAGAYGPDGGLVLLHARDLAEVEAIIAADPAVKDGIFTGMARPWSPRFLSADALKATKP